MCIISRGVSTSKIKEEVKCFQIILCFSCFQKCHPILPHPDMTFQVNTQCAINSYPAAPNGHAKFLQIVIFRAEFYSCHLCEATSPRLLADCSTPGMVTISFRRFSPLPGNILTFPSLIFTEPTPLTPLKVCEILNTIWGIILIAHAITCSACTTKTLIYS